VAAPGGEVAAWACHELGLGNLIRSTRLNFKEARFFRTAAQLRDGVIDESVVTLMHWIMADSGVALPGGER
jgi:hypothetical protein